MKTTKSKYSLQYVQVMSYKKCSDIIKMNSKDSIREREQPNCTEISNPRKFKIHPESEMRRRLPSQDIPRRFWISPDSLVELCALVLDKQALPEVLNWGINEVIRWIVYEIGFPQYRETFYKNYINGRKLLLLADNVSHLVAMNIKNKEHIRIIIESIRNLFNIEKILYNRNLYFPFYNPDTYFKLYRTCNGSKYENTRYSDFLRKMHIIKNSSKNLNHWQKLEKWLKHYPNRKNEIIAFSKKSNLYAIKEPNKKKSEQNDEDYVEHWCECMPSCERQWKKSNYDSPKKLSILIERNLLKDITMDANVIHSFPPEKCMEMYEKQYESEKKN